MPLFKWLPWRLNVIEAEIGRNASLPTGYHVKFFHRTNGNRVRGDYRVRYATPVRRRLMGCKTAGQLTALIENAYGGTKREGWYFLGHDDYLVVILDPYGQPVQPDTRLKRLRREAD